MNDGGAMVPLTDEQAKAIQEAFKLGNTSLELVRQFGGYWAKVLGSAPEDLFGLLVGDRIRAARFENMVRLAERTQARLNARQVPNPEPVPLAVALPLLEHAADESRDELLELWARLLAAAMDPTRLKRVRQTFLSAVKAMDPVDALVFAEFPLGNEKTSGIDVAEFLSRALSVSLNETYISLQRLSDLKCIRDRDARAGAPNLTIERPVLTAFGSELLAVLAD